MTVPVDDLLNYLKLVNRADAVADDAGTEAERYAPDNRPAAIAERRTHAIRSALQRHQAECETSPYHMWLAGHADYKAALEGLSKAPRHRAGHLPEMWWFDVHRRIAFGMLTLDVLNERRAQGRLYFAARDLRSIVTKNDALRDALGQGINTPFPGNYLTGRGGWQGLLDDLEAARDAVVAEIDSPGRAPRPEPEAVEREAIVRWARLARCMGDPSAVSGVIQHLCTMAGIKRHRSRIKAIVDGLLEQERARGHLRA